MTDEIVTFEQLTKVLSGHAASLAWETALSLTIAKKEPCYIRQDLTISAGNPSACEVILIEAPAAVGKSTLVKELSATCQVPLLDLSHIGVDTHSLRGIIGADIVSTKEPLRQFTTGGLPILVDALDESLIVSGEKAFENFLTTTWALLRTDRTHDKTVKLLMIGRPLACELVEISLAENTDIVWSKLSLNYFDRSEALALVTAQMNYYAGGAAIHADISTAAESVVYAYFHALAEALGMQEDELWSSEEGRSFAGYAPVLAALGKLLAGTKNLAALKSTFTRTESPTAWSSIENVARSVMIRERVEKFGPQLAARLGRPAPDEAYDIDEQYALLAGYITSGKFINTGHVKLHGKELEAYRTLAETWISQHPFLAGRDPANAVLGSMIYAANIAAGRMTSEDDFHRLSEASSLPFLWRSFQASFKPEEVPAIDGRHFGYILSSLSNDPIDHARSVKIIGDDDNSSAKAEILASDTGWHNLDLLPPLRFYGTLENSTVVTKGTIECYGYARGRNRTSFFLSSTSLTAQRLEFNTDSAILSGTIWLDAEELYSPPQIDLQFRDGAEVGWPKTFQERYPWNRQEMTVFHAPKNHEDLLYSYLIAAQKRLSGPGALTLYKSSLDLTGAHAKWFAQTYGSRTTRKFMATLLECELATSRQIDSSDATKVVLSLDNMTWERLQKAQLEGFTDDVRTERFLAEMNDYFTHKKLK